MKIKIGDPYIIGHNLSKKETEQIAQVLENSTKFKIALKKIKDKYGIPPEGFELSDKKLQDKALALDSNPEFIDDIFELTQVFNPPLPRYWVFSLFYFVLEGILRPPQYPEIITYPSKYFRPNNKEKPLGLFLLLGYVFIMIGENISKKQLHDYIDEEWPELEKTVKKLPGNPINKMPRFNLGKEIAYLKDVEKLTFPQIAIKLSSDKDAVAEYDVLNSDNVKTIYHRFKNKLNSLNNKNK